jgi:hypothetical protein
MEYVLPAAILLLSAGILVTTTDINKILGEYFMAASGHTKTDLTGGVFKTQALAGPGYGNPGNGIEGFSNFGAIQDGNGTPTGESASGSFYYGAIARSGARPAPTSAEYLYP